MLAFLGNIGLPELLIILVVALLLFGARLPDVARSLGRSVNEFKKGLRETEDEVQKPPLPKADSK
ncbi:MAG: twin-arginine translocase TatA/TatE family subunit [Planctomycetes bacterium]|nr:twin-arginine translocase TatA/TatE family subunit [Planctomycetota bacterium]